MAGVWLNAAPKFRVSWGALRAAVFTFAVASFFNGSAIADVLDIAADGAVTTHAKAAAFNVSVDGGASFPQKNRAASSIALSAPKSSCRADNCDGQIKQILKGGMVNYSDGERVCQQDACYVRRGGLAIFDGPSRPVAAFTPAATPVASPAIGNMLAQAAERHALDQRLLSAVAWRESHFHAGAVSPKGAVGVMQLMPETARALGVNQYDIAQNIEGGAAYLRQMLNRYGNNAALALAAYNAGPGMVDRYRDIPPFAETKAYVRAILGDAIIWPRSTVIYAAP